MPVLSRAVPAGAAVLLASAGLAVAAKPTAGGVYTGKVNMEGPDTDAPTVKLKVAADRKSLKFTLDCGENQKYTLKQVPIDGGKFEKTGKIVAVDITVKGRFKTKRKAKGSLDTVVCFASDSTFTAKRK